ncbi:MAG: glycogen(starch) synthase [Cyclobacteriaceae bacterium]|jgi:glycosyltransferase involved in cell wall biosynthesis
MAKLRVLMIGPGEPNALNSGLGVAAQHIAKSLGEKAEIIIIQPEDINDIDIDKFNDSELMNDLTKVNIRASISPYFYSKSEAPKSKESSNTVDSKVKAELDHFTKSVVQESNKLDFDVIYAHDWTAVSAGIEIKEKTNKPLVVHMHSLDFDRNSKRNRSWVHDLEEESFKKSDAIISVSDYTSKVIIENYEGVKKKKVHTVYSGSTPVVRKKIKKVFKEKLVLFVGRLTGQKGPNIFMEIAEKVLKKHPNTRFILAGDGHMMSDLINAAATKKMGSKFHFTGHIDRQKLEDLYSVADVYCMPSVSEPYGLTALEAASAELPVVLSKQSGAAEVLSGALSADHWDVNRFVKHIVSILKNDKVRKTIIDKNSKDLKKLSWKNTADQVFNVFDKVR